MASTQKIFPLQTIFYIVLLLVIAVFGTYLVSDKTAIEAITSSSAVPISTNQKREATFEIPTYRHIQTGSDWHISLYYRYTSKIDDEEIPNYQDMRKHVIAYLDAMDMSDSPLLDTVNRRMCDDLKLSYPIEAISCLISADGDHSSITTMGSISPLRFQK